ncbi:MAG: type II secretion system GspH family protein [Chitinispirillales bacterium]|jgi:prepilin-type N-terminal cleavage/methylation domain-containing protein|nr:type II secretion system GspH family protein [Chitinispirillales bacterium]
MITKLSNQRGFTILELMTTIFIFSIVSISLFKGLSAGDKIRGRANMVRVAAVLASNEAERIRNAALQGIEPQELTYTETVSGITFDVFRRKIDNIDESGSGKLTEMEISVEPQNNNLFPSYKFKLVQGLHQ